MWMTVNGEKKETSLTFTTLLLSHSPSPHKSESRERLADHLEVLIALGTTISCSDENFRNRKGWSKWPFDNSLNTIPE